MARISGIDIPREKRVEIALTYVYGIGRTLSNVILKKAGISADVRVKNLSEKEIGKLRNIIEKEYKVEGDLRRDISFNIKRLMDIGTYMGLRHRKSLPKRTENSHKCKNKERAKKDCWCKEKGGINN